jgi:hypothetical protein
MSKSRMAKLLKSGFGTVALLLSPAAIYAQCPLCYQAAASAGGRFIQALRSGILILLPAPFVFGAMVGYMAYRKRNGYTGDSPDPDANIASQSAD